MRRYFPQQFAFHLARPLEVSQERPEDFYHLYYDNLIPDPIAEMRRVYDWLGDDWTAQSEQGMRAWMASNPQNKHGKHTYAFEDWGITRDDMVPYFSDYLRAHPVARGAAA